MTFIISKEFAWSASHQLSGLRDGHPCSRMHGHNYVAKVTLASARLDDTGFVFDYGDLAPVARFIDDVLDHRHLNDVPGLTQPSAELLARYLHGVATELLELPAHVQLRVAISETPKTWAEYR